MQKYAHLRNTLRWKELKDAKKKTKVRVECELNWKKETKLYHFARIHASSQQCANVIRGAFVHFHIVDVVSHNRKHIKKTEKQQQQRENNNNKKMCENTKVSAFGTFAIDDICLLNSRFVGNV